VTLRDELRALPRPVWILLGGTLINRFGTFVLPFLILYMTRSGFSVAQAGMAVGAYGVGHLISSIAGGHLADRIGRRNTIAIAMFGSSITMLALSQARTFVAITMVTCIVGIFAELYRPASSALIIDLVEDPKRRVFAFGMYRFAVNLGVAAGPATAGFVADKSFFALFLIDAFTSLVYGVIALAALPHGVRGAAKDDTGGSAVKIAFADGAFVAFLIATLGVALVDFQLGSTYPLYLTSIGFSARVYGMLVSLNGLLVCVFELWITSYVRRFRALPVIAIGYALNNFGFALTGLAHSVPALAAMMFIWTTGEMCSSPMSAAYVAELAPERYRGRYMGIYIFMFSIGLIIGPPLGTFLFQRSPNWLWGGAAGIGVMSGLLLMASSRRHRQKPRDVHHLI
jgi:MFS family permease